MATDGPGVPGVAIGLGLAGIVLVYSAVKNQTVPDTLRALVRGEPLSLRPASVDLAGDIPEGGSELGGEVAKTAASYIGTGPYRWGGATPAGWDCSGFVTWVLHHVHGLVLPNNVHTTAIEFYAWSGAVTVPRAQAQPGDLACWVSHIGIVVNDTQMVDAATFGTHTRLDNIWRVPAPVIRRPKAYLTAASAPRTPAGG